MNKLTKSILTLAFCLLTANIAVAGESIDSIIKKSPVNKSATIAISVKNAKTGRTLYQYNENKLLNPASTLKLFTMKPSYDMLGGDYKFCTKLYKDSQNNLYIKLSGDPSFSTGALKELLSNYKGNVKDIVIDPDAVDYIEWGTGWMWDDDTNPYMPKISQYTINENKLNVEIEPGINGRQPQIKIKGEYPAAFVNMLSNGTSNNIRISRQPWKGEVTVFQGTVANSYNASVPLNSTERYFIYCLKKALAGAHIKQSGTVKIAPVPSNAVLISQSPSPEVSSLIGSTLKNSNNLYAELIFKTAGGKYAKTQGNTQDAIKMFYEYYADINAVKPVIADASGVSRNNLICTDWMSEALNKIYKQQNFKSYEELIAKPIEGTLSNRLIEISRNLRAKTGSITDVSGFTGYVISKSGTPYSFAILIQNYNCDTKEVKALENSIVKAVYDN